MVLKEDGYISLKGMQRPCRKLGRTFMAYLLELLQAKSVAVEARSGLGLCQRPDHGQIDVRTEMPTWYSFCNQKP